MRKGPSKYEFEGPFVQPLPGVKVALLTSSAVTRGPTHPGCPVTRQVMVLDRSVRTHRSVTCDPSGCPDNWCAGLRPTRPLHVRTPPPRVAPVLRLLELPRAGPPLLLAWR